MNQVCKYTSMQVYKYVGVNDEWILENGADIFGCGGDAGWLGDDLGESECADLCEPVGDRDAEGKDGSVHLTV